MHGISPKNKNIMLSNVRTQATMSGSICRRWTRGKKVGKPISMVSHNCVKECLQLSSFHRLTILPRVGISVKVKQ